jgi:hypothetical protein
VTKRADTPEKRLLAYTLLGSSYLSDVRALIAERNRMEKALRQAQHWHEQQDYDEALNIIDAALEKRGTEA